MLKPAYILIFSSLCILTKGLDYRGKHTQTTSEVPVVMRDGTVRTGRGSVWAKTLWEKRQMCTRFFAPKMRGALVYFWEYETAHLIHPQSHAMLQRWWERTKSIPLPFLSLPYCWFQPVIPPDCSGAVHWNDTCPIPGLSSPEPCPGWRGSGKKGTCSGHDGSGCALSESTGELKIKTRDHPPSNFCF